VFERFFSYRPQDDRRADHAGLGLAIARAVIQGYGGSIAAENRPGGGARFDITLPALRR
jgi:signal transduction histidine kinase